MAVDIVMVLELQSIWIIYCNLAIWLMGSKYLKVNKAIQKVNFKTKKMFWSIWIIDVELTKIFYTVKFHDLNFSIIQVEL